MARQLSGQYTINSTDTSEKAVAEDTPDGDVIRVVNNGANVMHIGNDGSDAVDNSTGYQLDSGESTEVRIDDVSAGKGSDLYVYGSSGDSLSWIVIG